jgi:hypothetical protein
MENIVFIVFLIIISIISSVIKSKKAPAPQPAKRRIPDDNTARFPQTDQRSSGDIREEVERILRGEAPEPEYTYNKAPEPEPVILPQAVQVEEFNNPNFAKPQFALKEAKYDVDQKEYSTDTKFQYKDTRALQFREKIMNVENLKEFIFISEIIGKPKALRRR